MNFMLCLFRITRRYVFTLVTCLTQMKFSLSSKDVGPEPFHAVQGKTFRIVVYGYNI